MTMTKAQLAGLADEVLAGALAISSALDNLPRSIGRCPCCRKQTLEQYSRINCQGEPEGDCWCNACYWSPTAIKPFRFEPLGQVATDDTIPTF